MKKVINITLSLLMVYVIVFSYTVTVFAEDEIANYGIDVDDLYVPSLPDYSVQPFSVENLPSSYDPRDNNGITPVKSQGGHSTCSVFATMSMMESAVYKHTGLKSIYSEEACKLITSRELFNFNTLTSKNGFYNYIAIMITSFPVEG